MITADICSGWWFFFEMGSHHAAEDLSQVTSRYLILHLRYQNTLLRNRKG